MFSGLPRTADIGKRDWHVAEVPLAYSGTTAVIGHPVVMSLRWRLDSTFDLVAAYSLETEFCLTARNTASARLSSKRARTRIELAFRAKSVLVGAENEQDGFVFITGV